MFGNLSQAASAPGIDPRTWIMLARVLKVAQDQYGVFADVQCLKTAVVDTAYVGTNAAGPAGGDWCALAVGEVVVVAVPYGDSDHGPVIISRFWGYGQAPISGSATTHDRIIKVTGRNAFRVLAEAADVALESALRVTVTAPQVCLGSVSAAAPVALAPDLLSHLNSTQLLLTEICAKLAALGQPCANVPMLPPATIAASKVKAE
jgi:hypothetical protein